MGEHARVWIVQCICPQRHAIFAAAALAEDQAAAETALIEPLRTHIKRMIGSGTINPWCGLCRVPIESCHYEVGRTRFTSIEEAEPALLELERQQSAVRRLFGDGKDPRDD